MAEITIFQDEAFSVPNLAAVLNADHVVPGQIAAAGLFTEEPSATVTQQIEKDGDTLELVAAVPRGAPGQAVLKAGRELIPFNCVHLPQEINIYADEIQGIRAFGSRTELEVAQDVVNARLDKARLQLDLTHEYHRVGAIKGLILNKDGSTLLNLYDRFGIEQHVIEIDFGEDVSAQLTEVLDLQEDAMGITPYSGQIGWCGRNFWKELIAAPSVREAYLASEAAAQLRGDRRESFEFGGALWVRYRGKLPGAPFVGDDDAYLVPDNAPDLFKTIFAPANYMETVNTPGLPYYAKLEPMDFNKGVKGEAQSNPLHICTRPRACIKLARKV
ncbi:major capsid protein [Pseudomonas solani]|uniref:major capsid protein n=1 Tax=Pseudomonas solani TaxID=2731552 RepID=UPI0035BE11A1